mmetsp:Transcript_13189/g.18909  ORF Transcript_13189/g.18909 Transcript_13189/m.18909 type:complete len:210 (-) Transcript_13189:1688-2317(-)
MMFLMTSFVLFLTLFTISDSYILSMSTNTRGISLSDSIATSSRRDVLGKAACAFVGASAVALIGDARPVSALEACPAGSNNCIRLAWEPPAGTSKTEAAKTLREVIQAYPQQGQDGVDCNGWEIVMDDLENSGKARVEYKSCIGFFAKLINGGKPFIDDLKLEVEESGLVQVRSSSRVGDSDFGVNKKRVDYLGSALKAKGWNIPQAAY